MESRCGHFVQCGARGEDEFVVEWAYKQTAGKEVAWDHLRARDPQRPVAEEEAERERQVATYRSTAMRQYYPFDADLLRFEEAVTILQAFMRGAPRPANWLWCEIPEEPENQCDRPAIMERMRAVTPLEPVMSLG